MWAFIHTHRCGAILRRPAPQFALKRQRVCLTGHHAAKAGFFLAQFVEQLGEFAHAAVERLGGLPRLIQCKTREHNILPCHFCERQSVGSAKFLHSAGCGILAQQGLLQCWGQGPGTDGQHGPRLCGEGFVAVIEGSGQCGGRIRVIGFRMLCAVTKQIAAAKAQIFQQGPLFRLIQTDKGSPQGWCENRPLPPVLQGRRKLLRLWPRGLVFLWSIGIGKKFQAWAFAQVEQQPSEQRLGRGIGIRRRTVYGICPAAQQQPQTALTPLRHTGHNTPPCGILAQTHDGCRGCAPHADALGSDKTKGILAPKAQAKLPLAPAAVNHDS